MVSAVGDRVDYIYLFPYFFFADLLVWTSIIPWHLLKMFAAKLANSAVGSTTGAFVTVSGATSSLSPSTTPTAVQAALTPQESIIPYTNGLTGVNLGHDNIVGCVFTWQMFSPH